MKAKTWKFPLQVCFSFVSMGENFHVQYMAICQVSRVIQLSGIYIYYMLTFLFLSRLGLLLCLRITGTASPSTSSFFWPFSSSSSSLSPPSPLHSLTWLSEEERWGGERGDNLLPGSLLLAGPFGLVFVSWKGDVNARKLWSMQTVCIYFCMCKYTHRHLLKNILRYIVANKCISWQKM